MFDGRYVRNEEAFKQYAYTALVARFVNQKNFEDFYSSLPSAMIKDEFLRVASFYLFLVKQGDWHVTVEGSYSIIDYFTNTYKLVALFSLIESLSNTEHQDFYQWLRDSESLVTFPICDQETLGRLYNQYKKSFGSIRRCVAFFDRLPPCRQEALCNAIHLDGKPLLSAKHVAKFLYDLRSKFVHEGQLSLQISDLPVVSLQKKKVVCTKLKIAELLEVFEEGVLAYFRSL